MSWQSFVYPFVHFQLDWEEICDTYAKATECCPFTPTTSHRTHQTTPSSLPRTMFSANENILLRQHKRRVIQYIEATIPENALELGTAVMVMQVSCRQPGCVPLETAITIVFPKPPTKRKKKAPAAGVVGTADKEEKKEGDPAFSKPLIPNLEESRIGGSFKTRILKPLADVTQDDVLDALPPSFEGGRKTVESMCLKARDQVLTQIGQLVGDDASKDSKEGRRLVAEYLKVCLSEYVERGCVAPEWGEPFSPLTEEDTKEVVAVKLSKQVHTTDNNSSVEEVYKNVATMDNKFGSGNFVVRRPVEEADNCIGK